MELINVPKDTLIYRSYKTSEAKNGFWFSLFPNETHGYGNITGEFKITKDIKLINIQNANFYNYLKELLTNIGNDNENFKIEQADILFPLGFDDIVFYKDMAKSLGVNPDEYILSPVIHTISMLYFNNRSRLSLYKTDFKFMSFLKSRFESICDGIISLNQFPDIIRNGMQLRELSVFDNSYIEYIQDKPRQISGGDSNIFSKYILPPITIDNKSKLDAIEESNNMFERIKNIKLDISKYKIYYSLYDPVTKTVKPHPTLNKKSNKTRRSNKRNNTSADTKVE